MNDFSEHVLISCDNDQANSATLWKLHSGTLQASYKGGGECLAKSLTVSEGYIIAPQVNKPFINVWQLNKSQKEHVRLIVPGKIGAMAVSSDLSYIVVGVEETCRAYQASTGLVVGIGTAHFQAIQIIRFCPGESLFACGGQDGMITVWNISELAQEGNSNKPTHSFHRSSVPISDLVFGSGNILVSSSQDHTLQVCNLSDGQHIMSLVFDYIISSLTLTPIETEIFCGTSNGNIYRFSFHDPPRSTNYHVKADSENALFINAHSKQVTALACSTEGYHLLSGSSDATVRIWHIESKLCVRTINFKGAITNLLVFIPPLEYASREFKPRGTLKDFQKHLMNHFDENVTVPVVSRGDAVKPTSTVSQFVVSNPSELEMKVKKLDKINHELVKASFHKVLFHKHAKQLGRSTEYECSDENSLNSKSLIESLERHNQEKTLGSNNKGKRKQKAQTLKHEDLY